MPLLTINNLLTSPVTIQDPTGIYGTSINLPGSGSVSNRVVSVGELGALEPQLVAAQAASQITYAVTDDPSKFSDDPPLNPTLVLLTPHAAAVDERLILTNLTTPGAVAVNLPAAAPIGLQVYVIDDKGDAGANNVTIAAVGGTINGGANVVINTNRGMAVLIKTAANVWRAVLSASISSGAAGGDLTGTYPNPTLNAMFFGAPQALSGAGAVNVTTRTTLYTSTGAGQALTLANGTKTGQRKTVHHTVDGGSGILTPATAGNFATATFTNVHDWAEFEWSGAAWNVVAFGGAVIA